MTWDSPQWRVARDAKLLAWCKGNQAAVDTVLALSTIAEVWDDLHDGDAQVTAGMVNQAFTLAMVKLQVNDFYVANQALFYALTVTSINAWLDANELQKSENLSERMMAFHLRNFGHEITMMAIFRAGGWEHLRRVSLEVRAFFDHEEFAVYEKERHVHAHLS